MSDFAREADDDTVDGHSGIELELVAEDDDWKLVRLREASGNTSLVLHVPLGIRRPSAEFLRISGFAAFTACPWCAGGCCYWRALATVRNANHDWISRETLVAAARVRALRDAMTAWESAMDAWDRTRTLSGGFGCQLPTAGWLADTLRDHLKHA